MMGQLCVSIWTDPKGNEESWSVDSEVRLPEKSQPVTHYLCDLRKSISSLLSFTCEMVIRQIPALCKLFYIGWINNLESYCIAQGTIYYLVIKHNGKECVYIYI